MSSSFLLFFLNMLIPSWKYIMPLGVQMAVVLYVFWSNSNTGSIISNFTFATPKVVFDVFSQSPAGWKAQWNLEPRQTKNYSYFIGAMAMTIWNEISCALYYCPALRGCMNEAQPLPQTFHHYHRRRRPPCLKQQPHLSPLLTIKWRWIWPRRNARSIWKGWTKLHWKWVNVHWS